MGDGVGWCLGIVQPAPLPYPLLLPSSLLPPASPKPRLRPTNDLWGFIPRASDCIAILRVSAAKLVG